MDGLTNFTPACVRARIAKQDENDAPSDPAAADMMRRTLKSRCAALCFLAGALLCAAPALGDSKMFSPGFWDPHARPAKPDLAGMRALRFLTDDEYPPFHFAAPDGSLAGFDIDLARAICEDLKLSCTIQARRFDTLIDSLDAGEGDAIIASIRIDEAARARLDFTAPYTKNPARFVALKAAPLRDATPETLRGKTIGVIAKTAHEAFLAAFFQGSMMKTFDTQKALTEALGTGEIDAFFGDGAALSFWLNGPEGRKCCVFVGGPFLDSRFFGEGVGIAVKKDDAPLRQALDYALADLAAKGVYTELYLKYFPLGFY
jgi:polar amino acid transport system substrate-binding protein